MSATYLKLNFLFYCEEKNLKTFFFVLSRIQSRPIFEYDRGVNTLNIDKSACHTDFDLKPE